MESRGRGGIGHGWIVEYAQPVGRKEDAIGGIDGAGGDLRRIVAGSEDVVVLDAAEGSDLPTDVAVAVEDVLAVLLMVVAVGFLLQRCGAGRGDGSVDVVVSRRRLDFGLRRGRIRGQAVCPAISQCRGERRWDRDWRSCMRGSCIGR